MSDINATLSAASSGLKAQAARMRIAAENVANANSTGDTPGADPFRRRVPVLEEARDRDTGAVGVRVVRTQADMSDFRLRFDPSHPAADDKGFVKLPNVDGLVEMMDLREAARAYEANLTMIEQARGLASRALDLLRR